MMLEQINRKHAALKAQLEAGKTGTKTVGIALPLPIHERLRALQDKTDPNRRTLKVLALRAIEYGLERLEKAS